MGLGEPYYYVPVPKLVRFGDAITTRVLCGMESQELGTTCPTVSGAIHMAKTGTVTVRRIGVKGQQFRYLQHFWKDRPRYARTAGTFHTTQGRRTRTPHPHRHVPNDAPPADENCVSTERERDDTLLLTTGIGRSDYYRGDASQSDGAWIYIPSRPAETDEQAAGWQTVTESSSSWPGLT